MKPVPHKTTWQVYTTGELYGIGSLSSWAWVAHGPRGHESGTEESAQAALDKAHAAAMLLMDPREARR